jgi:hypothetical protein
MTTNNTSSLIPKALWKGLYLLMASLIELSVIIAAIWSLSDSILNPQESFQHYWQVGLMLMCAIFLIPVLYSRYKSFCLLSLSRRDWSAFQFKYSQEVINRSFYTNYLIFAFCVVFLGKLLFELLGNNLPLYSFIKKLLFIALWMFAFWYLNRMNYQRHFRIIQQLKHPG